MYKIFWYILVFILGCGMVDEFSWWFVVLLLGCGIVDDLLYLV